MPATSHRAWEIVLDRVEADLLSGRLRVGDRLPPERELAAQLNVGRSSVREAVRVLEVLGLIRTGTGSGPTSGAVIVAAPRGGLSALLRLQVASDALPIGDVVRTRLILETDTVRELAESEPDLSDVHRWLDAMADERLPAEEFLALDAHFHVALADASGNLVVAAMMTGLRDAIEQYVRAGADQVDDWPAMARRLRAEHRAIVAAVESSDAPEAERLVRSHIQHYYEDAAPARPVRPA